MFFGSGAYACTYFFQFGRTAAVAAVRLAKERRVSKHSRLSLCGPNDREITAPECSFPLQLICNPVENKNAFPKTFPVKLCRKPQRPLSTASPRAQTARGEKSGFIPLRLHAAPKLMQSCSLKNYRPGRRVSRMGRGSVPTVARTFCRRALPGHSVRTVFLHNVNLLPYLLDF